MTSTKNMKNQFNLTNILLNVKKHFFSTINIFSYRFVKWEYVHNLLTKLRKEASFNSGLAALLASQYSPLLELEKVYNKIIPLEAVNFP